MPVYNHGLTLESLSVGRVGDVNILHNVNKTIFMLHTFRFLKCFQFLYELLQFIVDLGYLIEMWIYGNV